MARRKRRFRISPATAIGLTLVAGTAIYFIFLRKPKQQFIPNQSYVPPPPANKTPQAIAAWVQAITSIYGNVAPLFQPGGPFYNNKPSQEVLNILASRGVIIPRWN